jgi:hypothetical protein
MLNNIMQTFLELFSNIVLLNNIILVAFLVIFGFVFAHASMNKKSKLDWLDMLLDSDTQKLSLSKLGNFMGIALSSWMMIYFVQVPAAYGMFPSLFMAWLAFLGGVYTLNNFINHVVRLVMMKMLMIHLQLRHLHQQLSHRLHQQSN